MAKQGLRRKGFDEVHGLLLDAALEVFALRGFSKATTSEIARVAGASEPLLFRHFGSKAGLYDAAVVKPFTTFVGTFMQTWLHRDDPHPVETPVYEFTSWTYRELRRHRSLALALFGSVLHDDGPDIDNAAIRQLLEQCVAVIDHEARLRGWDALDVPVATRLMLGSIVAAALFKEWLYERPEDVSDQHVVDQLVELVLHGVNGASVGPPVSAVVNEDAPLRRVVIIASDQSTAFAAASRWVARRGVEIESMSWSGSELRLYHS